MADEDLENEELGTEGEEPEGQDSGEGDEGAEAAAEQSDAPSGEDDGSQEGVRDEEDRPLSRGQQRFQRLSNDNAGLREELRAIREQREYEARQRAAWEQQNQEATWNDRWSVMTPEEKVEYGRQEFANFQRQQNFQLALMRDQLGFEAKATVNPVYAKYHKEVEKEFQARLSQGRGMWREDILKNLLGERALSSAQNATRKARAAGQSKIAAQTTRPTSSRGDAASARGRQGDTAERRLAGVEI